MHLSRAVLVPSLLGAVVCGALAAPAAAAEPDVVVRPDGTLTYRDASVDPGRTLTGTLEIAVVEDTDGSSTRQYLVERPDGRLVPIELVEDLPDSVAGADVTAEVDPAAGGAPVEVATLRAAPAAAAAPSRSPHRAYVALAEGTSSSTATVQAEVQNVLDDWEQDSNGFITTFSIAATKRFAATCTTDSSVAWNEAAAQFPGISFGGSSGNHLVLIGTGLAGCAQFGLGTLGSGVGSGGRVWVREDADAAGRLKFVRQSLAHEIGHNLGLGHASTRSCSGSSCVGTLAPYGNAYSVMGASYSNALTTSLDTISRDQLGVLDTCEQLAVSLPAGSRDLTGTWYLNARGASAGPRGLTVLDPSSGRSTWVDWRDGSGRDTGTVYAGSPRSWPAGITLQRRGDGVTELLTTGSGSSLAPSITVGSSRTVDATTVAVGTPVGGLVPVTVSLTGTTGSGSAPAVPGSVTVAGLTVGSTARATTPGAPAGACQQHQWLRDGVPIDGETGPTLAITPERAGARIEVRTTSSSDGYVPSTSTVGAGVWRSTPTSAITGTVAVGRTVRAVKKAWTPAASGSFGTTWYIGGKAYSSASTLKISSAWKGRQLSLKTTGRRDGYPSVVTWTRKGAIR